MTISLHKWTSADKEALMALCNAVDRTFLSGRLPSPYDEADADWWLGMVAENEGKEGVWRAIVVDGQIVGSISVERKADENYAVGAIGYMILTPFWSRGIGIGLNPSVHFVHRWTEWTGWTVVDTVDSLCFELLIIHIFLSSR